MSIYNISFVQKVVDLLPPDKRMTRMVAWLSAFVAQIQYSATRLFTNYRETQTYTTWSAGSYSAGDIVLYGTSVYESLEDANTATPTDATKWRVYLKNFVGVQERVVYTAGTLSLTWALNRWFKTTFRQPPALSDIYIATNEPPVGVFVIGANEEESGVVYSQSSDGAIIDNYAVTGFYNATIFFPVAVYNALDPVADNRDKIIRNFADLYFAAGIVYDIQTY